MSYLSEIGSAARAGSLTAVRWLTAPLIVFVVLAALGYSAYDYYVTRTATRQIVTAIQNGELSKLIAQQVQQAAQKAQQPQAPQAPAK